MYLCETLQTPVVDSFDVAVCGGGVAGIAAALAAARAGKRTILLERQYLLGGLATAGIVTIYLPLCDGLGRQVSFGLAEELLRLSIRDGAEARYPKNWLDGLGARDAKSQRFEVQFNPQLFAIAAEELLLAAGVTLAYGTYAVGVERKGACVTHLITESKSGRTAYAVGAVVDATGDADVAVFADVATKEYPMGNFVAGWYYSVGADGYHLRYVGSSSSDAPGTTGKRLLGLTAEEGTDFTVRSHQATYRDVCERRKSDPSLLPVTMPTVPQLRMTRRLIGKNALTLADVHTFCADSIGMVSDWRERGPVYEVPFGSLCSETVENLFCAGRCVSVDDALWDLMRVIPCCAVTGEAAGLAAALYAEKRLSMPIL
ncbi:MAG: FAD-dependent oxidoreductase, partial [Clostridia bacterium]|nr:FAD-dependent oxidoreductase [Clostridia bacterium]